MPTFSHTPAGTLVVSTTNAPAVQFRAYAKRKAIGLSGCMTLADVCARYAARDGIFAANVRFREFVNFDPVLLGC